MGSACVKAYQHKGVPVGEGVQDTVSEPRLLTSLAGFVYNKGLITPLIVEQHIDQLAFGRSGGSGENSQIVLLKCIMILYDAIECLRGFRRSAKDHNAACGGIQTVDQTDRAEFALESREKIFLS